MKHPDYNCNTVSNAPHEKRVEIVFDRSRVAEITRALLLAEGYTPAELGLTANNEADVRQQAQSNKLNLVGKNTTEFNFFYKNAQELARGIQEYALRNSDVEISMPTVEFDAKREGAKEKIYPAMRIDRTPVSNLKAAEQLTEAFNNKGIPIHLTDRGRKIDIEPDREKGTDFVQPLRKLLGLDRNTGALRRQGPVRGED